MKVDVYLHGSKEDMWNKGEELGLSEEACRMFSYAAYEVKLTLDVEEATGVALIVAVDGHKLERT